MRRLALSFFASTEFGPDRMSALPEDLETKMAKRKLSAEQRRELRAELKKALDAGKPTPEILKETSAKYGISTITARWYLSSLREGKPSNGSSKARRGRPRGSRNRVASARDGELQTLAAEKLKKAKKAARLVPRWKRLVAREKELQKIQRTVTKQLQRVSGKAKGLKSRISELVEN